MEFWLRSTDFHYLKEQSMLQKTNMVTEQWLREHINRPNVVVLYTQMDNPVIAETDSTPLVYIPNSIFFDFENVFCNTDSSFPHTMPTENNFTKSACKLGIDKNSVIIIYDNKGIYCAPRVWWMFKSMGHQDVYILNGGLPNWLAQNMPTVPHLSFPSKLGDFKATFDKSFFYSADEIIEQLTNITLLDARSEGRFNGTQPEPRKGLRSGHVPTSINLPFQQCLDGTFLRSSTQLKDIFSEYVVKQGRYLVFSCGSGVTACILALAATEAGNANLAVYDGSWCEWGARTDLPVEL
jgi:thiosulfate/3-mercaptopyruvate sulfurtransferase